MEIVSEDSEGDSEDTPAGGAGPLFAGARSVGLGNAVSIANLLCQHLVSHVYLFVLTAGVLVGAELVRVNGRFVGVALSK